MNKMFVIIAEMDSIKITVPAHLNVILIFVGNVQAQLNAKYVFMVTILVMI